MEPLFSTKIYAVHVCFENKNVNKSGTFHLMVDNITKLV